MQIFINSYITSFVSYRLVFCLHWLKFVIVEIQDLFLGFREIMWGAAY